MIVYNGIRPFHRASQFFNQFREDIVSLSPEQKETLRADLERNLSGRLLSLESGDSAIRCFPAMMGRVAYDALIVTNNDGKKISSEVNDEGSGYFGRKIDFDAITGICDDGISYGWLAIPDEITDDNVKELQ